MPDPAAAIGPIMAYGGKDHCGESCDSEDAPHRR